MADAAAPRPCRRRPVRGRRRAGLARRARVARASTAPTSRSARASRWASASSTAARTWASWRHRADLVRQIPGRLVGRTHGRRRPARLRHDAARARAGHPARQGGQQHLHQPGAVRAGRDGLPRDARPARPARRRGAPAAAAAPTAGAGAAAASARRASTAAPTSTSSPSACPMRRASTPRCSDARRPGRPAARPLVPGRPGLRDALLVCATEVTTDEDIERFAGALREVARVTTSRPRAGRAGRPTGAGHDRASEPRPAAGRRARRSSRPSPSCRVPGRGSDQGARTRRPTRSTASRPQQRRATPLGPAGAQRARGHPPLHQPVAAQLLGRRRLLPARLVHHEVQPQDQRVGGAPARLRRRSTRWRPTRWRRARCELLWELEQLAGGDRRHARRHAPAGGRRARRADRHPDHPRLPPGPRRHDRREVIVPDSSHGTNPATASMAGFRTVTVPSAPTAAWTSTRCARRWARAPPR